MPDRELNTDQFGSSPNTLSTDISTLSLLFISTIIICHYALSLPLLPIITLYHYHLSLRRNHYKDLISMSTEPKTNHQHQVQIFPRS